MKASKIHHWWLSGGSDPSVLAAEIYTNHSTRVLADGGVIEDEARTKQYIEDQINIYGLTSEAEFLAKLLEYNPAIWGYKVGTGSAITIGQACEKLYAIDENADAIQATVASQPLLLRHSGDNYYFNPRVANNSCRTTTQQITAYNSATDTLRFTAKIFLNNQTTATTDFLASMGSAANFVIINKGTQKTIRFRGTANATDSSNYTPSATAPHWVRYTVTTTQVMYEWSADGTNWNAIGTVARPTVGTLGATFSICDTAGTPINATSIYHALFENVTAGTVCTFNPALYNRASSETTWVGEDCTWSVIVSSGATGLKGVMVDETVIIGDGVAYKLRASKAISQPYTSYAAIKRLGTGVIYGLAASSQLSNDATNTTLDNGSALNIGNTSTAKQLITAVANGASSSLQVNNGPVTSGDSGANNGTYIDLLANDASYGNYVLTSLLFSYGA